MSMPASLEEKPTDAGRLATGVTDSVIALLSLRMAMSLVSWLRL